MYNKVSASKILYWLSSCSLSVKKQKELTARFAAIGELWDEFPKSKTVRDFVGEKAYGELLRFRSLDYIEKSLNALASRDIKVITVLNPLYPELLAQPEVNAPLVLYYRGDLAALNAERVAVVGTRACSTYGRETAKALGYDLASSGVAVVSGLATGIDTYAHEGALSGGGKCIAVLGGGFEHVTPVGNAKLFDKILESGGLALTEYKPDTSPTKFTFPERNRIIAGLCRAVVVVEAGEKSGALITAELAAEQGREVFAVPGNVTSERSKGCNELLYQGANVARKASDILEILSGNLGVKQVKKEKIVASPEKIVDKDEKKVYSLLSDGVKTMDELIEGSGMSPSALAELLLNMELDDAIKRVGNNAFMRKK